MGYDVIGDVHGQNHELNAIGYATRGGDGRWLRRRLRRHAGAPERQHGGTGLRRGTRRSAGRVPLGR